MIYHPAKPFVCGRCGRLKPWYVKQHRRRLGVGPLISTCDCCCDGDASDCNDFGYSRIAKVTFTGIVHCDACCNQNFDFQLTGRTYDANGLYEVDFTGGSTTTCDWQEVIVPGGMGTIRHYNSQDGSCSDEFQQSLTTSVRIEVETYRVSNRVKRLILEVTPLPSIYGPIFYWPGPSRASAAPDTAGTPKLCETITNSLTSCVQCQHYGHSGTAVVSLGAA